MADNITLDVMTSGAVVKTDDDGSAHWQYVKLAYGADNTQTIVSDSNPLPIDDAGGSLTVDGTVTANLSATDNAVLDTIDAVLDTIKVDTEAIETAVEKIDDIVHVDDAAFSLGSSSGVMVMGFAGTQSVDANDAAALACDTDGALHISDGGNAITVDGTVTANLSSTDNTVLDNMDTSLNNIEAAVSGSEMQVDLVGSIPAGSANIGDVDIASIAAGDNNIGNVDILTIAAGDNNIGNVDIASALPAGSNAIGKLAANSGVDIGDVDVTSLPASTNTLEVVGDVAHDAAAAGNPVQAGVRATNSVEGLTQVANADASFVSSDLNGCIITREHTTLEEIISERVSNTNGTSTAFSNFAAGGSGIHNYITTISIYNSSSTDGYVDFRDGTGGSVIFTAPAPQTGGSVITFPVPLKGAANTALAFDVSEAISTVYISVVGFQAQG